MWFEIKADTNIEELYQELPCAVIVERMLATYREVSSIAPISIDNFAKLYLKKQNSFNIEQKKDITTAFMGLLDKTDNAKMQNKVGGYDFSAAIAELLTQFTDENNIISAKNTVADAIDYLRVCIKYVSFDLNATRLELEYVKKLLLEAKG